MFARHGCTMLPELVGRVLASNPATAPLLSRAVSDVSCTPSLLTPRGNSTDWVLLLRKAFKDNSFFPQDSLFSSSGFFSVGSTQDHSSSHLFPTAEKSKLRLHSFSGPDARAQLFWDVNDKPTPSGVSLLEAALKLMKMLTLANHKAASFNIYANSVTVRDMFEQFEKLKQAGGIVKDTGEERQSADNLICHDVEAALADSLTGVIYLVADDTAYGQLLKKAKERRVFTTLVAGERQGYLQGLADRVLEWEEVLAGKVSERGS